MADQENFFNPSQILIPRNSRRVHTPISDVNFRGLSDLIPTAAVTNSYPVVGSTTYGALVPSNQQYQNTDFNSFILNKLADEFRDGSWFTRAFFGDPNVPGSTTPVKTTSSYREHSWNNVLESISFDPVPGMQVSVQSSSGAQLKNRIAVSYTYRPGGTFWTQIITRWFLSLTPFNVENFDIIVPQPTEVSWDIGDLGFSGSFPECLHDEVGVPSIFASDDFTGTNFHELFPPTNILSWQDYDFAFEVINEDDPDPYFIGALHTAIAPPMQEVIKIKR